MLILYLSIYLSFYLLFTCLEEICTWPRSGRGWCSIGHTWTELKGQRPLKIICTYDNSSNDYANNNAKIIVVLIMLMNINTYTLEERGWTGEEQLVLNIKCLRKIKVFALF